MADLGHIISRLSDAGNAAETAYAVLREAIISNVFNPGDRLQADYLAKELGISKTPVREALRKLQAESLVVAQGNRLAVRAISEEQLFEIYYTREALEGMAARLAAERAQPAELAALNAIVAEMKTANTPANLKKLRMLRREFAAGIHRASRNTTLTRLVKHLQEQTRQFPETTLNYPGRPKEVIPFCKELLEAIEQRNPDEAERVMRANRRRTLELRILLLHGRNK